MKRRLLRFHQLEQEKGVKFTRQHPARMEEKDEFPRRVQVGANSVAWWEHEIDTWLESRPRGPVVFRGTLPAHRRKRQRQSGTAA
jgi:predicted DNA-binding transcriptional regulator AlpA